jgi:nitric oxide synthase oxygenase domain/subunit
MDAEIGVRNLADSFRYNMLPSIAKALGLTDCDVDDLPDYERLAILVGPISIDENCVITCAHDF